MTAAVTAGAASHAAVDGHAIDWPTGHRNGRRLQARIVKAVQAGRWGQVKALQHLLTHSCSANALAGKRVTEHPGKRTSGVDRLTWATPAKNAAASGQRRQRGDRPPPLRRVWMPKHQGTGRRPLGMPGMQDRAMPARYRQALEPMAATTGDPNSEGVRKERSPADASEPCYPVVNQRKSPQWVLEGASPSCFDASAHDWRLAHSPMDHDVRRTWLQAGCMEQGTLPPPEAGTPPGGVASPVLANLALDGLERALPKRCPQPKTGHNAQVNLVRYGDACLITGRSRDVLEQEVKPLVEAFLTARGLRVSPANTVITHLNEGCDFLGQHVRQDPDKLLIKPSPKRVKALLAKVRAVSKGHHPTPAGQVIGHLHPRRRGWAN